jgi:hypothetical protein
VCERNEQVKQGEVSLEKYIIGQILKRNSPTANNEASRYIYDSELVSCQIIWPADGWLLH